jgi:hypothetical protein
VLELTGAVLERAHAAERSDPEKLRSLHNRAVEAFNAMVL